MHSYILMCMHTRTYIFKVRACAKREGRGIHEVFVGYSWGIHMYRVCVGYVSGMYRVCIGTYKVRGGLRYKIPCRYLQVSKKSSTFVGNFESGSGKREAGIKNFELRILN